MEHFVRIVMEKVDNLTKLDESILPNNEVYESEQGATIIEIPLDRLLDEIVEYILIMLKEFFSERDYQ